jgi:small subunit ribosomal protein S13|tara:strand:+ start:8379 stop:8855 length:477 start_codon:yes stop_codon:yes gene_type:complete
MSGEFKHIVRLFGRDLKGEKKIGPALCDLKGVGWVIASSVVNSLQFDSRARLGSMTDQQIGQLQEALKDPAKIGLPSWKLNRKRDIETGSTLHLIGSDLEIATRNDISREHSVGSWRGMRHAWGLKVRGQRTRTSGRKGKTIGVKKTDLRKPTTEQKE